MELMTSLLQSLWNTLLETLPGILIALAWLAAGWIVAIIVRGIVRKALGFLKLNDRIVAFTGSKIDVQSGIAIGVYYLILLLALVGFFSALKLPQVSEPLESLAQQVLDYLPNLIAGLVLMLVAWLLATIVQRAVTAGLSKTTLDEKISEDAGMRPMSETLGRVLHGLVLLLFLPGVLGAFGLQGLLTPIQGMVEEILATLPNILAAIVLGGVGWFVAKILRGLVQNLLEVAGADKLGQRAGLKGTMTLSGLVGLIVFIFIFVPALIAALNALEIEAISGPATSMLDTMMTAIPNIFAAGVILAVAFFVSDFVANIISSLLGGMGFDALPGRLGIAAALPKETTPSRFIGRMIVFFVLLFATVEAASVLGFSQVSEIVEMFIHFGGQILLGIVIIGVGVWLSGMAHGAISRLGKPNSGAMAGLARFTILGLVLAMGLRAMGVADDIVNLAFGLTLGAVAVAVALSFGLGGREAAGKQWEYILAKFRNDP